MQNQKKVKLKYIGTGDRFTIKGQKLTKGTELEVNEIVSKTLLKQKLGSQNLWELVKAKREKIEDITTEEK